MRINIATSLTRPSNSLRASKMVFSIPLYFTIPNYFINYTIPFYNTSNISKLYFFFLILFKYYFLIFFYCFSFSLPFHLFLPQPLAPASTSSKSIPSKITRSKSQQKKNPNQTSTKNPSATPAKSQQKIHTKITQITTNLKPKPKLHTTTIEITTRNESLCKDWPKTHSHHVVTTHWLKTTATTVPHHRSTHSTTIDHRPKPTLPSLPHNPGRRYREDDVVLEDPRLPLPLPPPHTGFWVWEKWSFGFK